MWVDNESIPDCSSTDPLEWVAITDPGFVNITLFDVDNEDTAGTYTTDFGEAGGATLRQHVRFVQMQIDGELLIDDTISRRIVDTVNVRNDFYEHL